MGLRAVHEDLYLSVVLDRLWNYGGDSKLLVGGHDYIAPKLVAAKFRTGTKVVFDRTALEFVEICGEDSPSVFLSHQLLKTS